MEWISSLFLTGYGQRSRTSFFNTCLKKILAMAQYSASFSCLRLFPHLLVKIQNSFYACVEEGCSAFLTIAREKQT